jgi:DNA (cytosine-5)-methyltransferase 1
MTTEFPTACDGGVLCADLLPDIANDSQTESLNELHLFAGAGGGILGGILLGHRTVCAVEIESAARQMLLARQRDGMLPTFPIWDDVRTFDGRPWNGIADIVCGGFPCQDISCAGDGAGIEGERSGLWREMARIIGEIRPRYIFVENSPLLVGRGLAVVVGDIAAMGYDAAWCVLGAGDLGADHKRERCWILAANADRDGLQTDAHEAQLCRATFHAWRAGRLGEMGGETIWTRPRPTGARPMGVGNGVAGSVDRIKACGNGQVPIVAATAWRILHAQLMSGNK